MKLFRRTSATPLWRDEFALNQADERYLKCTHLSCAVFYVAGARRLECPCHEGYFAVEDGSVLQGPPPRPLPRVILRRRGDELVATGIEILPPRQAHASSAVCP